MANTYEITAVHLVHPPDRTHAHIDRVELGSPSFRISRDTVIADLRDPYGDRYYTYDGGRRADVVLGSCPHCNAHAYITTAPDYTVENNLLELPKF